MDNDGNFHTQSISNMQNAVYKGEMSVVDYYERQVLYFDYLLLLLLFCGYITSKEHDTVVSLSTDNDTVKKRYAL